MTHSHLGLIRIERKPDTGGAASFLSPFVVEPFGYEPGRKTTIATALARRRAARGRVTTVSGAALADYYALIAYAAATLEKNTAACRRVLYERARTSLVVQMRKLDPPLAESEIRREQFALEEAIRKLEAEKLSRLAQRDDQLIGKLNALVQKMHQMRQRMPLARP